jgi:hypothetical protein
VCITLVSAEVALLRTTSVARHYSTKHVI